MTWKLCREEAERKSIASGSLNVKFWRKIVLQQSVYLGNSDCSKITA